MVVCARIEIVQLELGKDFELKDIEYRDGIDGKRYLKESFKIKFMKEHKYSNIHEESYIWETIEGKMKAQIDFII